VTTRQTTRRNWLGRAVAPAAVAQLRAACGGPAAGTPGAAREPVTLSFLSCRPIAMHQFAPTWQAYQQAHNETLEVDKSGDSSQEKLTAMLVAGSAPDLLDANTSHLPKMYDSGFVLPLDAHLSRDRIALDRDWAVLGIERWRQKTYRVP
jgi:ABC-type glycerol-3-phosphate transport system substrate-binding protein